VQSDERLRLFLALRLPRHVLGTLATWQTSQLAGGGQSRGGRTWSGRIVPREHLHVTLAFLGARPAEEVDPICRVLGDCASGAAAAEFEVDRYRETRSVGMLVLSDDSGRAAALAGEVQQRLEELGVYRREERPWLPHVTVVRYRERPRLRPELPRLVAFHPSDAAAYVSRLHPSGARYEVLESFELGGR
jgi:RNA 2',3'-cyclic 3'-phosphodiesterase